MTIEKQFTSFVRWLGGEVVENLLSGVHQLPMNADYFLFQRAVVAELKCLEKNYFDAPEVNDKLTKLANGWVRDGLLLPEQIVDGRFSTDALPERCALQTMEVFAKPLREAVTYANNQLKATKRYFGVPDAKGLLILANEGNLSLNPNLTVHMLARLFRDRFSAVESFIYFTPHIDVAVPTIDRPSRIWLSGSTRDGAVGVPPQLLKRIQEGWVQFLQTTAFGPIETIHVSDEALLRGSQLVNPGRP